MTIYVEGLAIIVVLGMVAQWLAWRFNLPSIFLLLILGFIAGPMTGFVDPDFLLGNLLYPIVSFSVAIILFEGGLNLSIRELKASGKAIRNLIIIGTIVTWFIASLAGHFILGLNIDLAMLLGAILVVSGPTVIVPLLRHVRPVGRAASILRWEGIIIDPIGAMLAVLVFEAIMAGEVQRGAALAFLGFFKTILIGGIAGFLGAKLLVILIKKYWIPDFLDNPIALTIVIGVYAISNIFQVESGLLAVTVMGIVVANQKDVAVKQIIEFKESLRVLLIANLFIILAAKLKYSDLAVFNLKSFTFVLILILIARPLAVFLSTLKTDLGLKERIFLSGVAPRGIVAAAVASIFGIRLADAGHLQAGFLAPLTFMVIISTVVIYSIIAAPLARLLKLAKPHPQGVLIAGAHPLGRAIAKSLQAENFQVLLVDNNWVNISAARREGLPAYYGSVLSEHATDEMDLGGIGRIFAMTSNDEVNSLATLHFIKEFGRAEVYQLPPKGSGVSEHLRGRLLFSEDANYTYLAERFAAGATIKNVQLTEAYSPESFEATYGKSAIPLFVVSKTGDLTVFTTDKKPVPSAGQILISLVDAAKAKI